MMALGFAGTWATVFGSILIESYILRIGGISSDWSVLGWARAVFWVGVASMVSCCFGHGMLRTVSLAISGLASSLWLALFWGL
jgi:hypothetical protein